MNTFDFIIVGGGLSGLATAARLIESDSSLNILVYDATQVGDGASGVPAGMVNPITGQNANIVWKAEESLKLVDQRVETLSPYSETTLSLNNGIMRPAVDEELGSNLRDVFKKTSPVSSWHTWLEPNEVKKTVPFLKETSGALFLKRGIVIRAPEFLASYVAYLKEKGVQFTFGGPYFVNNNSDESWSLEDGKTAFTAQKMIITSGYKSRENKYWSDIPLHTVKGQLAIYHSNENVGSLPAISAYGYFAPMNSNQFVVGSTYEHHFHDEKPDGQGAGLLDQKLKDLLPSLYDQCQRIGQWSGVRATTPNRLPIIGEHPEQKGLYIFAGLGSKGLLFSELVGKQLAEHLLHEKEIPQEVSLYRFSKFQDLL